MPALLEVSILRSSRFGLTNSTTDLVGHVVASEWDWKISPGTRLPKS